MFGWILFVTTLLGMFFAYWVGFSHGEYHTKKSLKPEDSKQKL